MHIIIIIIIIIIIGERGVVEGRGFDSRWDHYNFSLTQSWPHYGPGVDSTCSRNKYQEYFLGVKAASAQGWQPYHLLVPTVMKSESLNFLEPSVPSIGQNRVYFIIIVIIITIIIIIIITIISSRNKYKEYFLGVKAASAQGLQPYHLHVQTECHEIWEP